MTILVYDLDGRLMLSKFNVQAPHVGDKIKYENNLYNVVDVVFDYGNATIQVTVK